MYVQGVKTFVCHQLSHTSKQTKKKKEEKQFPRFLKFKKKIFPGAQIQLIVTYGTQQEGLR